MAKLDKIEAIAHEDRSHPVQPERIGDLSDHASASNSAESHQALNKWRAFKIRADLGKR